MAPPTEEQIVTVTYEGQQVFIELGNFLSIEGTTFKILKALFLSIKDTEPFAFVAEYCRGYADDVAQYGLNPKNPFEGKAHLPAKKVAAAELEAKRKQQLVLKDA